MPKWKKPGTDFERFGVGKGQSTTHRDLINYLFSEAFFCLQEPGRWDVFREAGGGILIDIPPPLKNIPVLIF